MMHRWIPILAILATSTARSAAVESEPTEAIVAGFFDSHCSRCHDGKMQKGGFRLDTLSRDFGNEAVAQRWAEVLTRMNAGEMPPPREAQPKAEELGRAVDWISTQIKQGEAARMAKRGSVAHYRLSRQEYAFTIRDLLGVHYDVTLPGTFHEDPRWHGFDRIGSLLTLSPSHVERYYRAAESVLDLAYAQEPAKPTKSRSDANAGREKWLAENKIAGPVRWPFWPGARKHVLNIAQPGVYRIRIQLSGLAPPDGLAPHLTIWHQQTKRSVFDRDILAAEGKPALLELELALSPGSYDLVNEMPGFTEVGNHTLNVLNGGGSIFTNSREVRFLNPTGYKLFDDGGRAIYPMLLIDWVEWDGPIQAEADLKLRNSYLPANTSGKKADPGDVRASLKRFADRAWRRPATESELDRVMKLFENERVAGDDVRTAYRTAMVAILASKNFFYLEEGSPTNRRETVNDWELASRLSYFLWSSMPDEPLRAEAATGRLHEPTGLKSQLTRMLADPKIGRFTDSFPRQWLQLHRLGQFPPDSALYPDYDRWLETSMLLETTRYFDAVFQDNRPLREFLDSDWTILNPRLARHYGLPEPNAGEFQRVKLRPDDHRGGLLTQASILALTSDGTRHRPVHRGVWVSEAIFARTPPPPPPNVEPLEPTPGNKPKATIRMQLEAHATHATCASCHRKIDPLGFAFDSYDAIGRWRTEERVAGGQGANPKVDSSGKLADGREFRGPADFKRLLVEDQDRFAEAFLEQLATYALRRVMTIDDAPAIRAIAATAKADGYQLRSLIERFVLSDFFQKR